MNPYLVAGVDLSVFVTDWLAKLDAGEGNARRLLAKTVTEPVVKYRYGYGAHYMFANIGPDAVQEEAAPEVLLLFAVLATYQDAGFPGADQTRWEGAQIHSDRAFEYFHEIGELEAARRLRAQVVKPSLRDDNAVFEEFLGHPPQTDLATEAAMDQEMAKIDGRSIRAARLLDPEGDFDSTMFDVIS